ncbi:hypothetical protein [Chitinophaga vietnamensis]|uniref:hypothetical protein n=1 Tax=Chitinophaga vietnamensis TaxID=2593957 RepID=UPI001177B0EA|nr:hypothetical protein [Chitinophaga vietnamensis]
MAQEIKLSVNGHPYALQVEATEYNGHTLYYLLDDDLEEMFHHALPDHLILMDKGDGFVCSPKLSEMEGGYIAQQVWNAIRQQYIAGR